MKHEEKETRGFSIEVRAAEGDGRPKLRGYAATFNTRSNNLAGLGFTEVVAPGAFKKTLQEQDVKAFWNHNMDYVLGSTRAGTLNVTEDETGLLFECDPPDSASGFMESVRRGDVNEMSFGFSAVRDKWQEDRAADTIVRTLLEVRLYEVSPVAMPAYGGTSVSLRAREQANEIRSKFTVPPATPDAPLVHLADYRRMSLELAKRQALHI